MNNLPTFMSVYHMHAWYHGRSEESTGFFGTGVTNGGLGVGD